MNDDEDSYKPLLEFDTDNPEFARGVEIGRLWEQFKQPEEFAQTIHASNAEMVMRIGEVTGRKYTAKESGDPEWMFLHLEAME